MTLPRNHGGQGIASLRDTAERLRVSQRFRLKHSRNNDIQRLWAETSSSLINLDAILNEDSNYQSVSKKLGNAQAAAAETHIQTLSLQGALISSITSILTTSTVLRWTKVVEGLPSHLFRFARKALQQQLPTATNLARWKRWTDAACSLCQAIQTNTFSLTAARPLYWTGTRRDTTTC